MSSPKLFDDKLCGIVIVSGGAKMIYLNNSIRGYPKGLRAGLDPRKPMIEVDDGFTVVTYRAIPYPLVNVQVWGCGTQQSRFVIDHD
jgi:hypothetical protein